MRAGFYDPFLAAAGGGERYLLAMAQATLAGGARAVLLSPQEPDREALRRVSGSLDPRELPWERADEATITERSRDLDLLVALANDVPPLSRARRSVAMVQFPLRHHRRPWRRALGAVARLRAPAALASYDLYLCNSQFTRRNIERRLGVPATILAPPVDLPAEPPGEKDRVALSVGRFFTGNHAKRHDVLVEAFARWEEAPGWELHLAGGLDTGDRESAAYVERLRAAAEGLPVHLHVDASRGELEQLYGRAALYWHAAGFGVSERRHPERLEHFGITVVEAMAHGAVPLVYGAGGPAEIVEDGRTGLLWRTPDELLRASSALAHDRDRRERLAAAARDAAASYGRERFMARVRAEVLGEVDRAVG